MDVVCPKCQALHFIGEKSSDGTFTQCCHKGKFIWNPHTNYPNFLKELLSNPNDVHYKNFRDNIRSYNSAMSFASMGAQIDIPRGSGPYVFKVHGAIYHFTSHLHPENNQTRQFAQLYVIDSNDANQERINNVANSHLSESVLHRLDTFLRLHNPYAKAYKMLAEVENEESDRAVIENREVVNVSMVFRRDRNLDPRRFNAPTVDEVAMIFQTADGEPPFERDFRVYPRNPNQPLLPLNVLSPNWEPMTYAIFYPYGEAGWQPNLPIVEESRTGKRKNVSMLQWKVAHIFEKEDTFNPLLHGGKLFQQWAVDSYLAVEANNLNFIRNQQNKLRVELYRGLADHLNEFAGGEVQAGKPIVLPSSFQGSPRNMREKFCDAMSIVTRFGKPDIFLTMTCNPNWTEIRDNLHDGQQPSDRPDLVSRVFSLKLKDLIADIVKHGVLGKVQAWVYTIEFQKRGLPHAHMLIILDPQYKMDSVEKIDRTISAEIPDPVLEPVLHEIVKRTMIHGPCGPLNFRSPCMQEGSCTKKFPKGFQEATVISNDGFPLYRRSRGPEVIVRGMKADNRYVVPYNPFLSTKYDCHINVESCQSVKAIKYIFKYIYKGYDCASVEVRGETANDEISKFLETRYVCAPEAIWRLLENPMHDRSHAIYRLAVHLPDEQLVYFCEGNEAEALETATTKFSHLTAWFELNKIDEQARILNYNQLPYHYVFNRSTCTWTKRRQGFNNVIARMYSVSPRDVERFHLRLLLLHVRGATSFNDLKTVNGNVETSFKSAAMKLNLIADDLEWSRCLEEASTYNMPRQLRETFALICIFNNPRNPKELFESFIEDLIMDFIRIMPRDTAIKRTLSEIEEVLRIHGKTCNDYGLPEPGPIINMERIYIPAEEASQASVLVNSLNSNQRRVFDEVIAAIDNQSVGRRFFFIDGPGGSGKTYLYSTIMCYIRGQGKLILPYATTGIAADLLKGGRTVHSGFKIPIVVDETTTSTMRLNSYEARRLKEAEVIIIDEASMLSKNILRMIDLLLKEIMKNNQPFGGKVFILGGDFRQTSVVIPHGTELDIIEHCLKQSPLWRFVRQFSLTENMRIAGQTDFNDWLLKLGDGELGNNVESLNKNYVHIPDDMLTGENIVSVIYGNTVESTTASDLLRLSKKAILCTKNVICHELNCEVLALMDMEEVTYYSTDNVISEDPSDAINYPVEFLHQQCPSGMPPHILKLKVGALIMLMRNLNPKKGLLNGTRLVVRRLCRNVIEAEIITGSNRGEPVLIPRIVLEPSQTSLPIKMRRIQFPVILSFAMTINKSQGQSFDKIGIYLKESVFAHGQLYVALTRCRNKEQVFLNIVNSENNLIDNQMYTKNVVIKELLK